MLTTSKLATIIIAILFLSACNDKKKDVIIQEKDSKSLANIPIKESKESIEGTYVSNECELSVEITKTKNGFAYFLQTSQRKLKGKATFTKNKSGESYVVLEGIKWDDYEGDISNQEENDTIPSKELEIPVGIDASYVKDTLTIQNYGNAMNSYTKISECGSKYIQLIKKH